MGKPFEIALAAQAREKLPPQGRHRKVRAGKLLAVVKHADCMPAGARKIPVLLRDETGIAVTTDPLGVGAAGAVAERRRGAVINVEGQIARRTFPPADIADPALERAGTGGF